MRNLITGGAGFIGSHLADGLVARGEDVLILDDLSTGSRRNVAHLVDGGAAALVEGSTSDAAQVEELMGQVDRCFHLASAVGVRLICERPLETLLSNVRGCDVVLGAAARHGVRLLFASTSEVYGKDGAGALREESDRLLGTPIRSRWNYANAKTFGEMLAYGYHRDRGAEMTVARLFNTVGPRQTGAYGMVLPSFARQALAGEDLTVYGNGSQSRCFAHVFDVVEAILGLAESDAAIGRAFNVGNSDEITILELAERVIAHADSDSSVAFVPFEEAYEEGFEELGRRMPDIAAIRALLDWRPTRTVEEAIVDVLAYQRWLAADPASAADSLTADV